MIDASLPRLVAIDSSRQMLRSGQGIRFHDVASKQSHYKICIPRQLYKPTSVYHETSLINCRAVLLSPLRFCHLVRPRPPRQKLKTIRVSNMIELGISTSISDLEPSTVTTEPFCVQPISLTRTTASFERLCDKVVQLI